MTDVQELPDIHLMEVNPAKRSLQMDLLRRIIHGGDGLRSTSMTVACLPGKSAWDIDYFLQYEKIGYIIGIERDEEIARGLEERFAKEPRVEIFRGTVSEFLLDTDYKLNFLYLDYCSLFGLSVIQDIDILLRQQSLIRGGRCLVSFFNARETVTAKIAQRRLFEDLDSHYPSGENWKDIDSDRRRCAAFNALLYRYRLWPIKAIGHARKRGEPKYVGASAVHRWNRYKTVGGSMLAGYFTLTAYGRSDIVHRNIATKSPDKWLVRGRYAIKDRVPPKSMNSQNRVAKKMGRDPHREFIKHKILEFYDKHKRTPSMSELIESGGKAHPKWGEVVRETGLCPVQKASLEEIRGELRRIHRREGTVTLELLRKARLAGRQSCRRSMFKDYGQSHLSYAKMLDEMNIPHNLLSRTEERKLKELEEWVQHLEAGKLRGDSPHQQKMTSRRLLKYEDAVRELRRLKQLDASRKNPPKEA